MSHNLLRYLRALLLALIFDCPSAITSPGNTPRVVFFLGLEGSGHELWNDLLCSSDVRSCKDASGAESVGNTLRQLFAADDAATFNRLRAEAVEGLVAAVASATLEESADARTVVLNLPSLATPFNSDEELNAANQVYSRVIPLGRPDPVLLAELCAEAEVDLRLVVLVRNPQHLFTTMKHAHFSPGNTRNQRSTGAVGPNNDRDSRSNIATRALSAYELRVMHDQLACLQAQLLLLAAGDTHPHAGHQSSDLSPSDEGKGRRWAALAGPTWWRERVRFVDPDRVDSRTLDVVLRHIGVLAGDASHSSSWGGSQGSVGTNKHRNLRLQSGTHTTAWDVVGSTPIPSNDGRWMGALTRYNIRRRLKLGRDSNKTTVSTPDASENEVLRASDKIGKSGLYTTTKNGIRSTSNSSTSVRSTRGIGRLDNPHLHKINRFRRRLGNGGRQHHQQQLRSAILAHAYHEASEAQPPPLTGTNNGMHSRAKSDQVRSVIARAAEARKEAATRRGRHHHQGSALEVEEIGALNAPDQDSEYSVNLADGLSSGDTSIDRNGDAPFLASATAVKKLKSQHETASNVLRRPAHTQRPQVFGNSGNIAIQGDMVNGVDNSATSYNEFDSSATNQDAIDRDYHNRHRKLSHIGSSRSSTHVEQEVEDSVFGGEWRDFVLLYRHFVSRIVLPSDPWTQLMHSRQSTTFTGGSKFGVQAGTSTICSGKGKGQDELYACPNVNVLPEPIPNHANGGSRSKNDIGSEELLRPSNFDSIWQLMKPLLDQPNPQRTYGDGGGFGSYTGSSTSRSHAAATVVFFAGLEGTGHHALEQVLSHCLKPAVKGTLSRCVTDCLKGTSGPFSGFGRNNYGRNDSSDLGDEQGSGEKEGSDRSSPGREAMQALVWRLASLDLVPRPIATSGHSNSLGSASKANKEQETKSAVARRNVAKQLALSLKTLADSPRYRGRVVALNLLCPMRATGQMSYPNGMPNRFEERPLLHPNLRLLAELVTGAGLNFKVVLLHRPPLPILVSTTVKRNFASLAVQTSVLQHNTAVLLAQTLQMHPSFIAPCVDYETWFDQLADTSSAGRNSTHVAAMAAARLGKSLGLTISPPSGRPGSGYDGTSTNRSSKKRGRGERANRSSNRNSDAEVRQLSTVQQEEEEPQQRRRLGRGGVVQSNWKRAEGVPFDALEAAPLLSSFEKLHRLFVTVGCRLNGEFADTNLKTEKDYPRRRLKIKEIAHYDHRRNRHRASALQISNIASPSSGQELELAATEAPSKRRLSSDNCHWQAWNKKRVCNGKVMASLSGSDSFDGISSSSALRSSISQGSSDNNGLVGAMDGTEAIRGAGEGGGSSHHGLRGEHGNNGGVGGKRHGRERIHSPGQGSDPALLKPLGFDVVIAHYSHGLSWLNSALYRLNKTEPTRCFVYLKGLPGGGADTLAVALGSPGKRSVSKSALMTALNLTYPDMYFKQLPNVGREGHSYVYHLLALYGVDPEGDHDALPLHPAVDADYAKAMSLASKPVPGGRVLVFLKDSAPKEGGFDTKHNWRSSLHLISMAEGARREGLAGMNGAPPGVVLRNTGMGASWLAWSIRTEYLPAWRQSNGTLVRAHPVGILKWATARLQDDTALRHMKAANRICYKGLFAVRAVHALQYPSELWHRVYLQLSEGDNVEAGHYMERLWCPLLYRGPGSAHPPLKGGSSSNSVGSDSSDGGRSSSDSSSERVSSSSNHDMSQFNANFDLPPPVDEPLTGAEAAEVNDDGHGAVGINGYHRKFDIHSGQEASVSASDSQLDPSSELHHGTRNSFSLWHDAGTSLSHSDSDLALDYESSQSHHDFGDHRDRHHREGAGLFQGNRLRQGHPSEATLAAYLRSHHSDSAMYGETRDSRSEKGKGSTQESEPRDPHKLLAELHTLIEHHPTGRIHRQEVNHIHHLSGSPSERVPPESRDYEWR